MTKYTGPIQYTEDDRVFNKQFLLIKNNNQKQDMVIRAVRKMKERAQACVAVGGGVFEGRKL